MEIENSSLFREVLQIINSPAKPVHYQYYAIVHAGGRDYPALKVISIDYDADYELNYSDIIVLRLAVPGGTYAYRMYPAQANLDITLVRVPLSETGSDFDEDATPQSERYTAILLDTGNPVVDSSGRNPVDEDVLNITNIFEVDFQLINKSLEQIRLLSVGGPYRQTTVTDVIKTALTVGSQRVQVEGVRAPQGVDMVEANNTTKREHIIIPQGTLLVNLPEYVHQKCGGVYSAGMGYYLQGDHWYVYPCYDVTRYANAARTMTIINVPPNKFPDVDRTYRQDGQNLVVLATGEVSFRDYTDAQQLNDGNGVRFADATKFMSGFSESEGNQTVVSRGANNTEVVSVERENGKNNVKTSDRAINANPYLEYSMLARRQGSFLQMVWEKSNPSLVYPGMMIRVLYLKGDQIEELFGVILKAQHHVKMNGQGLSSMRHTSQSALAIFVQQSKK